MVIKRIAAAAVVAALAGCGGGGSSRVAGPWGVSPELGHKLDRQLREQRAAAHGL